MGYLEGFRIPLQERLRRDIRTERYPDTIREKPERFFQYGRDLFPKTIRFGRFPAWQCLQSFHCARSSLSSCSCQFFKWRQSRDSDFKIKNAC